MRCRVNEQKRDKMFRISGDTRKCLFLTVMALVAASGYAATTPQETPPPGVILKNRPAPGSIPTGAVVYVDDGRCPKGHVTELVGGSTSRNIPRTERCVPRPEK